MAEFVEAPSSSSSAAGPRSQHQHRNHHHHHQRQHDQQHQQQHQQRYYYPPYQYHHSPGQPQHQLHPYELQRQQQQQQQRTQHYQESPSSYHHDVDDDQSHGSPQTQHADPHGGGSSSSSSAPPEIIATPGEDWTRSLVKMAKGAELKKHSLTLQLQMTHILTYSSNLEKRERNLHEVRARREELELQRARLLDELRCVNEEREYVDMDESRVSKECEEYRRKIALVKANEYAAARREVDQLREELGLEPIPSLESQLEEKSLTWASMRRITGRMPNQTRAAQPTRPENNPPATLNSGSSLPNIPHNLTASTLVSPPDDPSQAALIPRKRGPGRPPKNPQPLGINTTTTHVPPPPANNGEPAVKRPRGRPKGSKNKAKDRPPTSSENTVESTGKPSATAAS